MRIAIAGFMHESNTFSRTRTDRAAFEAASLTFGDALIAEWRDAHHEVGGFIEGSSRFGYDVEPIVMAWATPAGPVADDVLEEIVDYLIRTIGPRLQRGAKPSAISTAVSDKPIDGLLLALHGAMVCEGYPDGDGEVLSRLRSAFGPEFPIVVTLDFHANLSEAMVSNSTAIVFYQTNPHVDQRQRGLDAASIMVRTVNGNVQPTQAFAKPSTLISIACQNTSFDPLQSFMKQARSIEQTAGVLSASISAGFPYADVYEIGPSVLVVTDNDQASAQRQADDLAGKLFDARKTLVAQLPNACDAVARAMRAAKRPVVLVEFGDNIGGGSPGDSTIILEELLRQGASGTVCVLYDPESARQAAQAGAGGVIKLTVGGKSDNLHGRPIPLTCRVCSIHDGKWTEEQPRHGGRRFNDQGQTVVLEVAKADIASGATAPPSHEALTSTRGSLIVLNSKRTPPFSLGQLTSLGIDPVRMHAIVVKAAIAYRAAYGSIAGEIIEVDTPGLTANDPRHFHYARARRPLYPIDEL